MASTYVVLPFIASALFLAPAITALTVIARTSTTAAVTLGALWLLLLIGALRENAGLSPVIAGAAAWLLSGAIGGWLAAQAGWAPALGQMAVVLAVMGVMASFNTGRIFRARGQR